MPATGKRDNSYYLRRLELEAPMVHRKLLAGKFGSPAEAFREAGLKRPRTRLSELKNAWDKATPATRREFMHWLDLMKPSMHAKALPPPTATRAAYTGEKEILTEDMKVQVQRILSARSIRAGRAMEEMGFNMLNPSLGMALHRGTTIKPELLRALSKWIDDNSIYSGGVD